MPCPDCGASLPREKVGQHACDKAQRAAYELLQLRLEADRFDTELISWLDTPRGRFAVYYAERERRRAA
jgi:hypothetical protein